MGSHHLLLTLLTVVAAAKGSTDHVNLNVQSDNFNGVITLPKWLIKQSFSSDDNLLPTSIRLDNDFYEIRADLSNYDRDSVQVKVVDAQTIRVEAKQWYTSVGGLRNYRRVARRFPVSRQYDVSKMAARVSPAGELRVVIPRRGGGTIRAVQDEDVEVEVEY